MNCEKCGAEMSGWSKDEPGVRSAVCTSGHRIYLYLRDDGEWETAEQKMARMRVEVICQDCKRPHVRYETYFENKQVRCDECLAENARAVSGRHRKAAPGPGRAEGRRLGLFNSPWGAYRKGWLKAEG